ncbi:glucosaminidase domain-containing protein [Vibrio coralliilyticus]|uniref:glucosaminidase domain-containing protein n=2 Tax=Vibrio TaxID=662 RepID=UPI0021870221|nr:glucosaminidase domain-containing protein [Vibrio sp. SCSIO 43186]USD47117.1 glucosaminidase domain-containing protein [Vibrio sp. SCSIO 43145]USD71171.1 glucosaminidase domain-containing protein [Vibrio sp. SCSIO 43139]USD96012.1 glucosaminidase [Vibrio coralliilyticus]
MRKSEFIAIATAGLIASCSFYSYEKNEAQERERRKQAQMPEYSISFDGHSVGQAPDFSAITDVKAKKQAFFDYLRPGIAFENQRILDERKRLNKIQARLQAGQLSSNDTNHAKRLGELYNVELEPFGINQQWLDQMFHRVDVIPEALVLVQGANESAWGTSRFAIQANNYFGQWCYSTGCGLVPMARGEGMTHEVAKFSSVQQSIQGYFMNVNRNLAYEDLREIRYQRHLSGESLTDTDAAIALTNGLLKYSERGEAYVKDLQAMIRHNQAFWEAPLTKE